MCRSARADPLGWLRCDRCGERWHRGCLHGKLPPHAFPGGCFTCVGCTLCTVQTEGLAGPGAEWDAITEGLANATVLQALCNAPGTGDTYSKALLAFSRWVEDIFKVPRERVLPRGEGVQTPVDYVRAYIGAHVRQLKTKTLKGRMAAIRWFHLDRNTPSPTTSATVRGALKGLEAQHAGTSWGSAIPKLALPIDHIRRIARYIWSIAEAEDAAQQKGTGAQQRKRARGMRRDALWVVLATAAGLRKGEAVALRRKDLWLEADGRLVVFIARSKTDQAAVGATRRLSPRPWGLPLRDMWAQYVRDLDAAGVPPEGPLLGNWHQPLRFLGASGTIEEVRGWLDAAVTATPTLTAKPGDALVRQLKLRLMEMVAAGLLDIDPAKVAAHSLRRSGANAFRDMCRRQRLAEPLIHSLLKAWGRWKSDESPAIYVFEGSDALAAVTEGTYNGDMSGGRFA